jgi:hypothetical protein
MNVTDERSPESPPQIEAFEFDPPAIAEGEESKGIIKLSGPAPPDTSITLEGAPAIAEFPGVLLVLQKHDLHCPLLLFDDGGTP